MAEAKSEEVKAEEVVQEKATEETKEETAEKAAEETKEEAKEESKEEAKEEAVEDEAMEEEAEAEAKELEEDAAEDKRKKVKADAVAWSTTDSTLNVMQVNDGNILMSLTEGGFQHLVAGVRGTAGVKGGRYMFEVKIVEHLHPTEAQRDQGRNSPPRNLVHVGVSLAGSSLFLAGTTDGVCFDSEGYFHHGKTRNKVSEKLGRDQTVALLINLDEKSPNAHTVSLFRDGQRLSKPQPLPENLRGKVLYPTINYKNVTMHVNLGPATRAPLPFTCRMLQDAAAADIECASQPTTQGPCEVVLPVGLPDQGVFGYVDSFLEKHATHVELSNRKIIEWASNSGVWKPKGDSSKSSNDKPDMNFGVPALDNQSVRSVLNSLAPAMKHNYVVMELRNNLLVEERKKVLQRFSGPDFKRVALVLMGEPTADYKERVQALMLADKTAKAEAEKKKKAANEERKRLWEEKKKKAEEARKSRDAKRNAAKKDGAEEKEEKEEEGEKKDEEMGVEEQKEEPKVEEDTPIELTDEEKKLWYLKCAIPDLSQGMLAKSYASFTLPAKEEGFDEVKYVWQPKDKCDAYLREWLLDQKRTQRAEDLEPSQWFKGEFETWRKTLSDWKRKQSDAKDPNKRKQAQKKKEEEAKKNSKEGDGEAAEGEEAEEAKPEPMNIDASEIDVDTVEDVTDLGNGEPLFFNFAYEDWTLLAMRYELHLLVHAFRKDLNDADRPSFREAHLEYYFEKYFKKPFKLQHFNVDTFADFLELLEDSVGMAKDSGMLEAKLPEDTPLAKFVKLAEEHRRDRARRVDAGDETAQLKFKRPAPPPPRQPQRPQGGAPQGKGDYRSDKGKSKGDKGSGGRPAHHGGGAPGYGSGREAPRGAPPPSRYGGNQASHQSSHQGGYQGNRDLSYGARDYGSQKRSYGSSSYPPAKEARTSYSGGGRDHGKGGGGGKSGGTYYGRR